jgi:hypothetical protein
MEGRVIAVCSAVLDAALEGTAALKRPQARLGRKTPA